MRTDRLAVAVGELRDGGLVAGEHVTEEGMALRERLVVARTAGLRELIDDWEPDRVPGARPRAAAPGLRARAGPGVSERGLTSRTKGSTAGHCASSATEAEAAAAAEPGVARELDVAAALAIRIVDLDVEHPDDQPLRVRGALVKSSSTRPSKVRMHLPMDRVFVLEVAHAAERYRSDILWTNV